EVRAQSAKVLGECRFARAYDGLIHLLRDEKPRVRCFAAMSLGKLGRHEAASPVFEMLRQNADKDPYLRHAGVMALTWIGEVNALLNAGKDAASAVRMGALLTLRRLQRPEITMFLNDRNPALALE